MNPTDLQRFRLMQLEAALRIFEIFNRWLRRHPDFFCVTRVAHQGKFELVLTDSHGESLSFHGESLQDAYAQAAQTIEINGGTL